MCSVKVLQASDLVFVKRLRLTAGQKYSDAVNVLLRAKLAHHFAVAGLAIVEKADSWVGHVFHLLGYVLILPNWFGAVNTEQTFFQFFSTVHSSNTGSVHSPQQGQIS